MKYTSPKEIMDEIASATPSYGGIRYDRLEGLGLQWPCPTAGHPGTAYLHKDKFTRGKGKFHVTPYAPAPELPDQEISFYPDNRPGALSLPHGDDPKVKGTFLRFIQRESLKSIRTMPRALESSRITASLK